MRQTLAIEAAEDPAVPARIARAMLWGIAGAAMLLLFWAGFAHVPEMAVAPGRVVPQRQLQTVSSLEGGSVTAILVRPGQRVAAGQALLRLDPASATADLGRNAATVQALRARIARLEAEWHGSAPQFPADLIRAAPGAVAAERALWSAHMADATTTRAGDAARSDGAARALAGAEAERRAHGEARAQAAREVALIAPLVDKGIEPRISLDRARSALAQASAAEAAAHAAVARAAANLAEARAADRGNANRWRSAAADALTLARAELAAQSAAAPALAGRVDHTILRSPIAGTVQRVLVTTIGGSVAPGAALVEVVPGGEALVVEAMLRPSDIGFVRIGQRAAVRLSAYDASRFGTLAGRVSHISPDVVLDTRTGTYHFAVRIDLSDGHLFAADGQALPIVSGMEAEIELIGQDRSILSYLLDPMVRLRDKAFRER